MILKLPRWFVKYSQDSPRNYRQRMCQKSAPRLPEMECPGSGRVGPPTATNSHQLLLSASLAGATSATTEDIDPRGRHHTGACYDGDVHRTAHQPPPPPDTIKQVAPSHHTWLWAAFISSEKNIAVDVFSIRHQGTIHMVIVITCQQIKDDNKILG